MPDDHELAEFRRLDRPSRAASLTPCWKRRGASSASSRSGPATNQGDWTRRVMLLSGSFTHAMRLPPPTSLTCCCTCAPASTNSRRRFLTSFTASSRSGWFYPSPPMQSTETGSYYSVSSCAAELRPYWSGIVPQPKIGTISLGTDPHSATGSTSSRSTVQRCSQPSPKSNTY